MIIIILIVNSGDSSVGHSQAEKAQTRERILAEASRQVRQAGLDSISVGSLMKSVGLTHGGFYVHFASREALVAEALERALLEGEAKAGAKGAPASFSGIVRGYLSRAHREARDSGCAVSALVSDVARADVAAREIMTEHVEGFIGNVAKTLDGDDERAILAVSAMVGALTLSRIVTDPERSNAILKAARAQLDKLDAGTPESPHRD